MDCSKPRALKGVFTWNDGSSTRLWVKTDEVTKPNAQCDDRPSMATGFTLAGAAVGQAVPEFQHLIGSDPGDVESRLTGSGYTSIRTNWRENGDDSFWKRGGRCVDVRTGW